MKYFTDFAMKMQYNWGFLEYMLKKLPFLITPADLFTIVCFKLLSVYIQIFLPAL